MVWTSCQTEGATYSPEVNSGFTSTDLSLRAASEDPCDEVGDCQDEEWVEDFDNTVTLEDFPGCTFVVNYRERECRDGYDFQILGFGVIGSCPSYLDSLILYSSQGDAPLVNFMLRMQRRIANYYAPQIAAKFTGQIPAFPSFTQVGALVMGECLSYCLTGLDPILNPEPGAPSAAGIPPYATLINCGDLCCEFRITAADREGDIFTQLSFPTKVASENTCEEIPEPPLGGPTCTDDNGKGYLTQCFQHCSAL